MEFELQYRAWANRFCLLLLYAHLPLLLVLAIWFEAGIFQTLLIGTLILTGPTAQFLLNRSGKATSLLLACSTMGISALLIHVGHGMIELHFHIFAAMAFLIVFGSIWPILAAAATIAVHHLLFWWLLPQSVFNYNAGLSIVLVHAVFVLFETGPACWIALRVGRAIQAQSITTAHLKKTAAQMLSAAGQLDYGGVELSRCAAQESENLVRTTKYSGEIECMSLTTSERLNAAVDCIEEVDNGIRNANTTLDSLTRSMNDISASSDRIGQIIRVIDGIALQTNILALNAAVESARAGAAGAGFAVVANEVRALAQRCAEAARNSSELISESVQSSRAGKESVGEITTAILAVTGSAVQARALIGQASAGGGAQALGVASISHALVELEANTRRTASSANENSRVGRALTSEAQKLMAIVESLEELAG